MPPYSENPGRDFSPPTPWYEYDGNLEEALNYLNNIFVSECNLRDGIIYNRNFNIRHKTTITYLDYSAFNQDALALAQGPLNVAVDAGSVEAGTSVAQTIVNILSRVLGTEIMGGVLDNPGERLDNETNIPESVLGVVRLGNLLGSVSQTVTYTSDDYNQSQLDTSQLKALQELIDEVRETLNAALEGKEFDSVAYTNGVADGALSVPIAILRAYIVVGGDSQGLNGEEKYQKFWLRVNLMDQELNRLATDPVYRNQIKLLVKENLNEGLSVLSGSQLSYAAGRLSGRLGASTTLSGYGKIVAISGDYYYAVARAGVGIAAIPEWISFGESLENLND